MPPPPPLRREASDGCALACLRMLLAARGTQVSEARLRTAVPPHRGGVALADLAGLAARFRLEAEIGVFTADALQELLGREAYPITFVNRVHFDARTMARKLAARRCVVGAVVLVKVSGQSVWVNDPRTGKLRQLTRKKFEAARNDMSNWCMLFQPAVPML